MGDSRGRTTARTVFKMSIRIIGKVWPYWAFLSAYKDPKGRRSPYLSHTYCIAQCKSLLCMSQLIRKLESERRVGHDTAHLESWAMLTGRVVTAWLESPTFRSVTQSLNH